MNNSTFGRGMQTLGSLFNGPEASNAAQPRGFGQATTQAPQFLSQLGGQIGGAVNGALNGLGPQISGAVNGALGQAGINAASQPSPTLYRTPTPDMPEWVRAGLMQAQPQATQMLNQQDWQGKVQGGMDQAQNAFGHVQQQLNQAPQQFGNTVQNAAANVTKPFSFYR